MIWNPESPRDGASAEVSVTFAGEGYAVSLYVAGPAASWTPEQRTGALLAAAGAIQIALQGHHTDLVSGQPAANVLAPVPHTMHQTLAELDDVDVAEVIEHVRAVLAAKGGES